LDFETTQPNTQIEEESNLTNAISANEELQNIKVLVAEDMALNQLLIKIILADLNFVVDIAENGKIAVNTLVANSLANQVPYDIILMDLQMPEMNGFEATTYIRQELKSNIPIIALTADVTTVDVNKCLAVGMNDYISKPIDEKLLYSKMIKCLKKQAIYNEST
jgi:CheY-like chemotaxis protein